MFHYSYINLLLVSPNSSLFLHAEKDFSKFLSISSDALEGSIKFDSQPESIICALRVRDTLVQYCRTDTDHPLRLTVGNLVRTVILSFSSAIDGPDTKSYDPYVSYGYCLRFGYQEGISLNQRGNARVNGLNTERASHFRSRGM